MKLFKWFKRDKTAVASKQAVPSSSRRIFDWVTGAWQSNTPYTGEDVPTQDAAAFACRRAIAEDVAKLPIRSITLTSSSAGDSWQVDNASPFALLMAKPNAYQTRFAFIVSWLLSLMDTGVTIVFKQRNGSGAIIALHVIPYSQVTVLIDNSTGEVFYSLPAWPLAGLYTESVKSAADIIHDIYMPLLHPLAGTAPTDIASTYTAIATKSAQMVYRSAANNGIPAGVLEVIGDYTEAQVDAIRVRWDALRREGHTAVVTTGAKFTAMTAKATDMQQAELWKMSNSEICMCYGVPEWRINPQSPSQNARASEAAQLAYYSQTLQPRIESIEMLLDQGLKMDAKTGVEFDVEGLYRLDVKTQAEVLTAYVKGSVTAPNEARVRIGYTPVKGGEEPIGQMQYWPLSKLAERDVAALNPQPAAAPVPEEDEEKPDVTPDTDEDDSE